MKSMAILIAGVLFFLFLVVDIPDSALGRPYADQAFSSIAYKRCRDVTLRNSDGSIYTHTNGLFQKHTTCALARRLARRYLADDGEHADRILGFSCSGGSDGVACSKGRRRITWGYYFD